VLGSDPHPATINEVLECAAARYPDEVFHVGKHERLTFAGLRERADRAARRLAGLGLEPGDRLVVWLPNGSLCIELLFACARLGIVLVTAGMRLRMADVAYLIEHSRAKAIVYTPRFLGTDYESMALGLVRLREQGQLGALEHVVRCGDGGHRMARSRTKCSDRRSASAYPRSKKPRPSCATGGTTGRPKGCVHDHRMTARNCARGGASAPARAPVGFHLG
jgi:fatty-acyl-CoA synthase